MESGSSSYITNKRKKIIGIGYDQKSTQTGLRSLYQAQISGTLGIVMRAEVRLQFIC